MRKCASKCEIGRFRHKLESRVYGAYCQHDMHGKKKRETRMRMRMRRSMTDVFNNRRKMQEMHSYGQMHKWPSKCQMCKWPNAQILKHRKRQMRKEGQVKSKHKTNPQTQRQTYCSIATHQPMAAHIPFLSFFLSLGIGIRIVSFGI